MFIQVSGFFALIRIFSERSPSLFLDDGWDVHVKEACMACRHYFRRNGVWDCFGWCLLVDVKLLSKH